MTGDLNDYLRLWNLSDPELLARSPRGDVYGAYRNDEKVVLKLLTPIGVEDESDAVVALRYFDGHGAVRLLAEKMGAPVGRLRACVFAYACLSASWPDKPEGSEVQRWFLTVARNAERHVDLSA